MRPSNPKTIRALRLLRSRFPVLGETGNEDPLKRKQSISWLTYREAAAYTGWSIGHLQNLVSAGRIPVYGRPRVRRFRRDMLDLYLTNPDMAMRKFLSERNDTHGR